MMRKVQSAPNLCSMGDAKLVGVNLPLAGARPYKSVNNVQRSGAPLATSQKKERLGTLKCQAVGADALLDPFVPSVTTIADEVSTIIVETSSKGILAAECFLVHGAEIGLRAPNVHEPTLDSKAALAACLATPSLEENETLEEILETQLRRMALQAEAQLQLRYMREVNRRGSVEEEEREGSEEGESLFTKRKRELYGMLTFPRELFSVATGVNPDIPLESATTSADELMKATFQAADTSKSQLHLEAPPETAAEAVIEAHHMTQPDKELFEITIDESVGDKPPPRPLARHQLITAADM